jgi:predicted aspartyl protease
MIHGQVDSYNQAVIPLDVRTATGQWETLKLVIDTGFTGYMTLPPAGIAALQLPFQQRQTYTLGDDRDVNLDVHLATVLWDGQPRDIAVLSAEGDILGGCVCSLATTSSSM